MRSLMPFSLQPKHLSYRSYYTQTPPEYKRLLVRAHLFRDGAMPPRSAGLPCRVASGIGERASSFARGVFRQVMKTSLSPQPSCSRCGTCCRKGGPALHREDRHLVEQGLIHTRHLYTIRRGEWVHDPITGVLAQAAGDIIKIKGGSGTWACRFLDDGSHTCRIYADRPLECRTLTCWNTAGIERVYAIDRLTREDLISGIAGLWELVSEHQERCEVERLRRLRMPADGPRSGPARAGAGGDDPLRHRASQPGGLAAPGSRRA